MLAALLVIGRARIRSAFLRPCQQPLHFVGYCVRGLLRSERPRSIAVRLHRLRRMPTQTVQRSDRSRAHLHSVAADHWPPEKPKTRDMLFPEVPTMNKLDVINARRSGNTVPAAVAKPTAAGTSSQKPKPTKKRPKTEKRK